MIKNLNIYFLNCAIGACVGMRCVNEGPSVHAISALGLGLRFWIVIWNWQFISINSVHIELRAQVLFFSHFLYTGTCCEAIVYSLL
jgi:hypothetical protein